MDLSFRLEDFVADLPREQRSEAAGAVNQVMLFAMSTVLTVDRTDVAAERIGDQVRRLPNSVRERMHTFLEERLGFALRVGGRR